MSAPVSLPSRAFNLEQIDAKISDQVVRENLELLTKHTPKTKYIVDNNYKLSVEDRMFLIGARRWWYSEGWAKTCEAIEFTFRKVELITEEMNDKKLMMENSIRMVRLSEIIKSSWFNVKGAVVNTFKIGEDYGDLGEKYSVASKKIKEMVEEYNRSFKRPEWQTFFHENKLSLRLSTDNLKSQVLEKIKENAYRKSLSESESLPEEKNEEPEEEISNEKKSSEEMKVEEIEEKIASPQLIHSPPMPIQKTMSKHENGISSQVSEHCSNDGETNGPASEIRNRMRKNLSQTLLDQMNGINLSSGSLLNTGQGSPSMFSMSPNSPNGVYKGYRYVLGEWPTTY